MAYAARRSLRRGNPFDQHATAPLWQVAHDVASDTPLAIDFEFNQEIVLTGNVPYDPDGKGLVTHEELKLAWALFTTGAAPDWIQPEFAGTIEVVGGYGLHLSTDVNLPGDVQLMIGWRTDLPLIRARAGAILQAATASPFGNMPLVQFLTIRQT